jgi:hypothetical protein
MGQLGDPTWLADRLWELRGRHNTWAVHNLYERVLFFFGEDLGGEIWYQAAQLHHEAIRLSLRHSR